MQIGNICVDFIPSIEEARTRWERLQANGVMTPFQSIGWVSILAETIGRAHRADFSALVARDMASSNDLMLLPLAHHKFGPFALVESPDFSVSDYNSPIVAQELAAAPEHFLAVWDSIVAAISSGDLLRVNKIPAQIGHFANPCSRLAGVWPKDARSWAVELPNNWAEYEERILSRKFRRQLRSDLKKLDAAGPVEFVEANDRISAEELFASLCAHREARFSRLGRKDVLRLEPYRQFYWELVRDGLDSGLGSLTALKLGSTTIATMLGLKWRDRYVALIPTMDENSRLHGIGKLMVWFQLKEMHERGYRLFDFALGNESYKRDFGASPTHLYELSSPLTMRGYPLLWGFKCRAAMLRWQGRKR